MVLHVSSVCELEDQVEPRLRVDHLVQTNLEDSCVFSALSITIEQVNISFEVMLYCKMNAATSPPFYS